MKRAHLQASSSLSNCHVNAHCQEESEVTTLEALAALAGAVHGNPLAKKMFAAGGHLARLTPLLDPHRLLNSLIVSSESAGGLGGTQSPVTGVDGRGIGNVNGKEDGRRRWGWGARSDLAGTQTNGSCSIRAGHGEAGRERGDSSGIDSSLVSSPAMSDAASECAGFSPAQRLRKADVGRIRAALGLVASLVADDNSPPSEESGRLAGLPRGTPMSNVPEGSAVIGDDSRHVDTASLFRVPTKGSSAGGEGIRAAVAQTEGLMEALCELALSCARGLPGGEVCWQHYGVPVECQAEAMAVLTNLVAGHATCQVRLAACRPTV